MQSKFYENSINSLVKQIQAYNFTEEQIEQYIDGLILSTPNTVIGQRNSVSAEDDYHYRPFPDEGTGYEVQSLKGYNQSTAFGIVGDAKTNKPEGQAAYMFFTIGGNVNNNKYISNDYGIGYFNGSWKATASGPITG